MPGKVCAAKSAKNYLAQSTELLTGQHQKIRQTFHPKIPTEPPLLLENIVILIQAQMESVKPSFALQDADPRLCYKALKCRGNNMKYGCHKNELLYYVYYIYVVTH